VTLDSLLIFAKTVEANSFSEAARRLNMPVSTVSRRIAELEAQLGVRLIERSTRSLRITDIGSEVLEHAQKSAEHCDAVEEIVASQLTTLSGILRLAAPPSLTGLLVVPLATAFQALYPDVRVHVRTTDHSLDHVDEGIDLSFRIGPSKDSSLITRQVLRCRQGLFASTEYLDRHGRPGAPSDLPSHRLIALASSMNEEVWTFKATQGETETFGFLPQLAINDLGALRDAITAGAGIGRLPLLSSGADRSVNRLEPVLADRIMPPMAVSITRLGNPNIRRLLRVFTDFVVKTAPGMCGELADPFDEAQTAGLDGEGAMPAPRRDAVRPIATATRHGRKNAGGSKTDLAVGTGLR